MRWDRHKKYLPASALDDAGGMVSMSLENGTLLPIENGTGGGLNLGMSGNIGGGGDAALGVAAWPVGHNMDSGRGGPSLPGQVDLPDPGQHRRALSWTVPGLII